MSQRIALTDGSGRWFDPDKATKWDEATWWNGNNHISKATGSQWGHEALYLTPGKVWILKHWSDYDGVPESYDEATPEEAAAWLVQNGHEPPPDLADVVSGKEV